MFVVMVDVVLFVVVVLVVLCDWCYSSVSFVLMVIGYVNVFMFDSGVLCVLNVCSVSSVSIGVSVSVGYLVSGYVSWWCVMCVSYVVLVVNSVVVLMMKWLVCRLIWWFVWMRILCSLLLIYYSSFYVVVVILIFGIYVCYVCVLLCLCSY